MQNYGSFRSGGLVLGAFNLELMHFADTRAHPAPDRIDGIAVGAATLDEAPGELALRLRACSA